MKKPVLLIVESSDVGAAYTAEASLRLGFEPVFLADLNSYQGDTRAQLSHYCVLNGPTTDVNDLICRIADADLYEVAGVVTFLDSRLRVASELARQIGVPGPDETVEILKSKDFVQALIPEFSPKSLAVTSDVASVDVEAFLAENVAREYILKPCEAAGAIGISRISRAEVTAERIRSLILNGSVPSHLSPDAWILQESREGELVSLEGFVQQGEPRWLGANGREKVGNTESAMFFPYEKEIHPLAWITAKEAVRELVVRSGFQNGYFHVEFIVSGTDVTLIDANMGRLGGGPVGELIAESFGVDPIEVYRHVISVSLGWPTVQGLYVGKPRKDVAGICYGVQDSAVIGDIEFSGLKPGFEDFVRHTRILDSGTRAPAMGTNNWAWVGMLSGLRRHVLKIAEQGRVQTEKGWVNACFR